MPCFYAKAQSLAAVVSLNESLLHTIETLVSSQRAPFLVYETTTLVLVIRLLIQYQRTRKVWASHLMKRLLEDMLLYLTMFVLVLLTNDITRLT